MGATKDSAIFYEDFEFGLGGWQTEELPVNVLTWEDRSWEAVGSLPNQRPGSAAFGVDPINGDCVADIESGVMRMESPPITIPSQVVGEIRLAFDHYVSTESRWDGGNIKYNIDGGSWKLLPENSFMINGYSDLLHPSIIGSDNPLAGEYAFTGSDEGSVSGSWGTSVVDLSNLVMPEQVLRLRWEMGTDGCNGRIGWYVDDVRIYSCQPCSSQLLLAAARSSQEILFEAADQIITVDTVLGLSRIHYSAGNTIEFSTGFSLDSGAVLEAIIDGCDE
ncbi:MAG: hypothetical protein HKN87_21540 [Saprospiraceae bacterium]|nr:hypothetical protein [Saprospiraceae bacterium]